MTEFYRNIDKKAFCNVHYYQNMKRDPQELKQWISEFQATRRRGLKKRLYYSFVRTFKPVLDEASFRSFDSMKSYRQWCEKNLPSWLGYGRTL